jgi:hypothetical protein
VKIPTQKHDTPKKALTPDDCIKIFNNALEDYESKHPHWHFEVLVSLIKWGIRNLKHFIEEKRDSKITWKSPFVELHYPVELDWKSPRDGDILHGKQILGKFTKEDTGDVKALTKTLAGMMAARFNVMALGHFTNGTWFEKRANAYIPYLPVEFDAAIKKIEDKQKQHEAAEEVFRPFSIGATRIDLPSKLKHNARLPKKVAEQLGAASQRMDIPGVSFSGDVNSRKIWAGLIFEIHPLTIDYDKQKAYHAVTIGLAFEHKLAGNNLISLTPAKWPRADREIFWNEILQSLNKLTEWLIPKNERQASIIMKDNEGLEIIRTISNPKDIEAAKKWITDFGKVDEKQLLQVENLKRLLEAKNNANTPDEKGRTLEELVAGLFSSIAGFAVDNSDKRVKTETEEIDLTVSNGSDDPRLKREEAIILAECKNWSSKCGKNEFVEFRSKMENRKGRCSLGFLISWNGFAETITKEMLRGSHERLLIVPLDGKQIQDAVRNGSFFNVIMSAWNSAIMI